MKNIVALVTKKDEVITSSRISNELKEQIATTNSIIECKHKKFRRIYAKEVINGYLVEYQQVA